MNLCFFQRRSVPAADSIAVPGVVLVGDLLLHVRDSAVLVDNILYAKPHVHSFYVVAWRCVSELFASEGNTAGEIIEESDSTNSENAGIE